jgi:hypothetical protein
MYAIISDWMPFVTEAETEAPTKHSAKGSNANRRELEFRAALNSYMADYRKHRALMSGSNSHPSRKSRFTFLHKFAD